MFFDKKIVFFEKSKLFFRKQMLCFLHTCGFFLKCKICLVGRSFICSKLYRNLSPHFMFDYAYCNRSVTWVCRPKP